MHSVVLALDVGGSSVKSALVADYRHIIGKVQVDEIYSGASASAILHQFAGIISRHLANMRDVQGIAFAFPGPFDYEQGISLLKQQAKYDSLYGIHIAAQLKELLGEPAHDMRFRNDAEAAILGEVLYGAGAAYPRLLGVTLGTGLGSAFIAEGKIVTNGDGLPPHGWLYSCAFENRRADDVFSTRGLLARLREGGIQADVLSAALHTSDSGSLGEVFASFATDLGTFVKPYVLSFGADAVLVTGGIANAWQYFSLSLSQTVSVPVMKGTLDRQAALLGAAALY